MFLSIYIYIYITVLFLLRNPIPCRGTGRFKCRSKLGLGNLSDFWPNSSRVASHLRLFQHTELEHTPTGYGQGIPFIGPALPGDCRTGVRYRGVSCNFLGFQVTFILRCDLDDLSNEKSGWAPGCLRDFVGDEILPSYVGINKPL